MTNIVICNIAIGLIISFAQSGEAQEPGSPAADHQGIPPAVIAIIENGERLRSGQYRCQGNLKATHWTLSPQHRRENETTSEYELTIEADFDFDTDRVSFRSKHSHIGGPAENMATADKYRWYLNVPGLTVELRGTENRRTAFLHSPIPWDELWPNQVSRRVPQPVYDPRLLGWGGWDSLPSSFEEFVESSFIDRELTVIDEGGGIQKIEVRHPVDTKSVHVSTFWIDEQQGWQPVRSSFSWFDPRQTPDAKARNEGRKPYEDSQQTWENHGGVWVMKSLSLQNRRGTAEKHLQLSFDWENVNQPIPADRFDWTKSWKYGTDYHYLIDKRLGGREIDITDNKRGRPYEISLPRSIEAPVARPNRVWWLVPVNIALISCALGWFARRHLVRQ